MMDQEEQSKMSTSLSKEGDDCSHDRTQKEQSHLMEVCEICNKVFSNMEAFELHFLEHSGQKSFSCEKNSRPSTSLKTHCLREKLFSCDMCGRNFSQERHLHNHMSTHTKVFPFNCQFCEKSYERKGNLEKHVRMKHKDKDDGEPVKRKQDEHKQPAFNLNTKMNVEHEEFSLPFSCTVCEKTFLTEYELKLHNFRHTGVRTYNCNVCNEVFLKEVTLNRHFIKHVNEINYDKKFECNKCCKKFRTDNALEVHSLIHEDNKPFSCEHCSKTFAQRGNLNCHLLIHTGEKPYTCEICGKGFRQRGNLQNHIFVHTEKKPFKCQFCPSKFAQKGNLKVHLKKIHSSNGIKLE